MKMSETARLWRHYQPVTQHTAHPPTPEHNTDEVRSVSWSSTESSTKHATVITAHGGARPLRMRCGRRRGKEREQQKKRRVMLCLASSTESDSRTRHTLDRVFIRSVSGTETSKARLATLRLTHTHTHTHTQSWISDRSDGLPVRSNTVPEQISSFLFILCHVGSGWYRHKRVVCCSEQFFLWAFWLERL